MPFISLKISNVKKKLLIFKWMIEINSYMNSFVCIYIFPFDSDKSILVFFLLKALPQDIVKVVFVT